MQDVTIIKAENLKAIEKAKELRALAYSKAGKLSLANNYQHELDNKSEIYLLALGGEFVATFAIYSRQENFLAFQAVKSHLHIKNFPAMYVHSLAVLKSVRSANLLKAIFGKIFQELVCKRKRYIVLTADSRLVPKYRWIGFKSIGKFTQSHYSSSGKLAIMYTRQERLGIYGLHADPLRWNIFLKAATEELIAQGKLNPSLYGFLYNFYSIFAVPAKLLEYLSSFFLRSKIKKEVVPCTNNLEKIPTFCKSIMF